MLDTRNALESLLDNVDTLLAEVDDTVRSKVAQLQVSNPEDMGEIVSNMLSGTARAKDDLLDVLQKRAEARKTKVATALRIFKVAERLSTCGA